MNKPGVAIGSPLSLVIVNLYMEEFRKQALNTANHTPTVLICWQHICGVTLRERTREFLNV